jgi:molybdopterin-guanine dinucleotide biosynthesis protein A
MSESPELAPLCSGVLVGGASRRFGSPKALAPFRGRPMAERVAGVLGSVVGEVVLLGGGPVPDSLAKLPRVEDAPGFQGPLAGILGALCSRPKVAWLVVACDQPLISAAACCWLIRQRRAGQLAVLPRQEPSRVEPVFAIYEPEILPHLQALASNSLQELAQTSGVYTPEIPRKLRQAWTSLDFPGELERYDSHGR